ncbi:MAG TPA: ATP-binding protein, partial [Bacteroidales bacterium]|nr:ATP-binding protein [Bacteroidales bacterium]
QADRIHFTNIIANLIDNALKYSSTAPDITLTTADFKEGVLVSVKDRGIGISHNNLENIFKKLYRVPTGKVHNVKGFGLGLFYVKRLVDLHHGQIWVESEPGKGSRFFVYWPHEMNEG